jgi:hypothetical protein
MAVLSGLSHCLITVRLSDTIYLTRAQVNLNLSFPVVRLSYPVRQITGAVKLFIEKRKAHIVLAVTES